MKLRFGWMLWAACLASAVGAQTPQELAASERALVAALQAYSEDRFEDAAAAFAAAAKLGKRGQADPSVGLARYNLAMMHLRDEVRRPDKVLARQLLEQAARGQVVLAHHALAQLYELGAGTPKNLPRSNLWLERGAKLGHVQAQVDLGTNFMLGRGVGKSMERAAHWFREAAKAGDVGAQYLLASFYEQGDGVPQDLRLAAYWYGVAAANGDEAAPAKFKEVEAKLQN